MKRSEALELIENILISDAAVTPEVAKYVKETILGTLEKAGMAPPKIQPWDKIEVDKDEFDCPTYKFYLNGVRVKPNDDREWEPEDEVKCGAV